MRFLSWTILALFIVSCACVEEIPIKIVKTKPTVKPNAFGTPPDPIASRPPAPFTGPERFKSLLGRCFSITAHSYEYKLCPFQNVTQKTVGRTYQQFHGLLGVWQNWRIEHGTYHSQQYTDGTDCPTNKKRRTEVEFKCSSDGQYSITAVEEPQVCEYSMSIACPEACGWDRAVPSSSTLPSSTSPSVSTSVSPSTLQSTALPAV